ncbi:hypothetical protein [Nocardioides sp. WS12]|uniref:hypothetical protein n=1 Tax=Nocardioides sp. WS12 TaxID=2486272 RepID=UPI0015FDEE29|nr:hypothetical protein [Nocardioides sp. WS12]
MNDTVKVAVQPEVEAFVVEVESRLADLSAEERDELIGGLRADLSERLAEHSGPEAPAEVLGDPAAYAVELRTAAGFAPVAAERRERRPVAAVVGEWLDSGKRTWVELVDKVPGSPREFLESLQPAWWVLRAWVAWMLLQEMVHGYGVSYGVDWLAVLAAFVIGSVQLARGEGRLARLRGHVAARLALIGLNVLAVCLLPSAMDRATWGEYHDAYEQAYVDGATEEVGVGLMFNGVELTNLFVYDAQGAPVTGAQLFDGAGRPLAINDGLFLEDYETLMYPWLSNGSPRFNVFPLPIGKVDPETGERAADAWDGPTRPALPDFPFPTAPTVELPQPPAR